MEFSRPEYWSGKPFPSLGDLPNPEIEPRSPALQADSLPVEPQGMPKNTGVGNLSLLQQIFPTQESIQGLLHCRWILYWLSYQESSSVYIGIYLSSITVKKLVILLPLKSFHLFHGRILNISVYSSILVFEVHSLVFFFLIYHLCMAYCCKYIWSFFPILTDYASYFRNM